MLMPRTPGVPRSCQMDGHATSTNTGFLIQLITCKRRPDRVSGRTLRWFIYSVKSTVPLINGGEIFYVVMMTLGGSVSIITLRTADRDRGSQKNRAMCALWEDPDEDDPDDNACHVSLACFMAPAEVSPRCPWSSGLICSHTLFDDITPQNLYYSIVTKDFREASEICYNTIRESWSEIDKVASEPNGLPILSKKFRTCTELSTSDELKDYLDETYSVAAQYNHPPRYPVTVVCGGIDGAPEGSDK
ncbi:Lysosomal Pro-X carboxypeptidase [Vitis vinifera]|uniref:Lysosomal Pro-X carboxypeptidase n=1 Tax=Vitis vinifera TaxID=29760 RepID=A0A438KG18_VITVI|nr:Lysosomal Pro-X carboxypeptidase [Vitis vinifera]